MEWEGRRRKGETYAVLRGQLMDFAVNKVTFRCSRRGGRVGVHGRNLSFGDTTHIFFSCSHVRFCSSARDSRRPHCSAVNSASTNGICYARKGALVNGMGRVLFIICARHVHMRRGKRGASIAQLVSTELTAGFREKLCCNGYRWVIHESTRETNFRGEETNETKANWRGTRCF